MHEADHSRDEMIMYSTYNNVTVSKIMIIIFYDDDNKIIIVVILLVILIIAIMIYSNDRK